MSHQLDFLPWIRRVRRQAAAVCITATVIGAVAEMTYWNLVPLSNFTVIVRPLWSVLPWLEAGCGLATIGTVFLLISTWGYRDWWVDRWVRSHENFVG